MNDPRLALALLQAASGGVGDPSVNPYYPGAVGDPHVQPMYPGVGAPLLQQANPADRRHVQYSDAVYVSGDVTWYGTGREAIDASASGHSFTKKPQRPITPQKFFCPSTVQGLTIDQLQIGGTNIFASQDGVPIEIFSEVSTSPQINWPTIDTSVGLGLVISNLDAAAKVFQMAAYGTAIRR